MSTLTEYANRFETVRLERQDGVLQVTIHNRGGEAVWDATETSLHHELGLAFREIAEDLENRVVILTGAGDAFCAVSDITAVGLNTPEGWDRILREGQALIRNLLDIPVPVIGAVNGPALYHAELVVMSDIVLASDQAQFADLSHVPDDIVPGDGVQVWWPMLLGPNRGRYFLLMGERIDARDALALGIVGEVLPHDQLNARAWEIARKLAAKPPRMLRHTRAVLTQHLRRRMADALHHGLALEGLAAL